MITLTNLNSTNTTNSNNVRHSTNELEKNYAAIKLERFDRQNRLLQVPRWFFDKMFGKYSHTIILGFPRTKHWKPDETFLKGYHEMLASFSTQVMRYTADYVKQKVADFEKQHETEMETMCDSTPKEEFIEIKNALATNRRKRTKALREIKERKFIRLKSRAKTGVQSPPKTRQHDISQPNMRYSNQNEDQTTNRV